MDAVKFLQERNRMYESGAPTPSIRLGDDYDPEIEVKVVEKWSATHPRNTRQNVFLEQYPEAAIDERGVLRACPMYVSAAYRNGDGSCKEPRKPCINCRREFWMQEVEL